MRFPPTSLVLGMLAVMNLLACNKPKSHSESASSAKVPAFEKYASLWDSLELNKQKRVGEIIGIVGLVQNYDADNRQLLICRVGDKLPESLNLPIHTCGNINAVVQVKAEWTQDFLKALHNVGRCEVFLEVVGKVGVESTFAGQQVTLTTSDLPAAKIGHCVK